MTAPNEAYFKSKPDFEKEFTRKSCQHYSIDAEIEIDADLSNYDRYIPSMAFHGDIMTSPVKYSRSLEVYFVNFVLSEVDVGGQYKYKLVKKLCQEDRSAAGYCNVPREVTRKLKNPLEFYAGSFTFGEYSEADFAGIDIDTEAHQELIKSFTGGRLVSSNKTCCFLFDNNEWEASKGLFIWCDSESRFIKLRPAIEASYLS